MSTQQKALRLYLNTSIVIRALEEEAARRLLKECCRQHQCVVSSVHWLEDWREDTIVRARVLLGELGVEEHGVDTSRIGRRALAVIRARGWSESRLLDIMHILAALLLDCDGIIAVDRFIARRAREYGLLYVKPVHGVSIMGRLYREWRKRRNQAGELLARVFDAEDMGYGRKAWQVYEEWRAGKLTFEEAKKRLEKLLAEAIAEARA